MRKVGYISTKLSAMTKKLPKNTKKNRTEITGSSDQKKTESDFEKTPTTQFLFIFWPFVVTFA